MNKFKYIYNLMSKILFSKSDNSKSKKEYERSKQNFNLLHKNNISYIERPNYISKDDKQNINVDYSKYMIQNNKANLCYNSFLLNESKIYTNEKEENNLNFKQIDNNLPNNIYHNFSKSTRLNRKQINYDINLRNTYSE